MSTTQKDALHQAAAALRAAELAVYPAQRLEEQAKDELRKQSRYTWSTKEKMYDAFYVMAVLHSEMAHLEASIKSYDDAKARALKERNEAGDDLDRAANQEGRNGPEDLERCAVRFAAAQEVLDHILKGEMADKRRVNVVRLRAAEVEAKKLEQDYAAKKGGYEGEDEKLKELDHHWNVMRQKLIEAFTVVDARRSDLRKAAREYAASEKSTG